MTDWSARPVPIRDEDGPTIQWMDDAEAEIYKLQQQVKDLEKRDHFLECLEAAGVDNWDGFDYAHEMMSEQNG